MGWETQPRATGRESEKRHTKKLAFSTLFFFSKALGKNRIAARLFPRYFLLNFDHEAKRVHRDCRDAPARADLDEKELSRGRRGSGEIDASSSPSSSTHLVENLENLLVLRHPLPRPLRPGGAERGREERGRPQRRSSRRQQQQQQRPAATPGLWRARPLELPPRPRRRQARRQRQRDSSLFAVPGLFPGLRHPPRTRRVERRPAVCRGRSLELGCRASLRFRRGRPRAPRGRTRRRRKSRRRIKRRKRLLASVRCASERQRKRAGELPRGAAERRRVGKEAGRRGRIRRRQRRRRRLTAVQDARHGPAGAGARVLIKLLFGFPRVRVGERDDRGQHLRREERSFGEQRGRRKPAPEPPPPPSPPLFLQLRQGTQGTLSLLSSFFFLFSLVVL